MNVVRKDATITNTDQEGPGSFEVVLSAPTKDRDGETLLPEEWKQPLPKHITFDVDHGMSVASTVGSGVPRLDEATGNLVVSGTYSSLPRAQEVRTLVNEGHIKTTSVAYMEEKSPQKDGKQTVVRELLNGAFVAIPSNREALVLASKGVKVGARNSAADAEHIQAIHDSAAALGAACEGAKAVPAGHAHVKSVAGSLEATQDRVRDALNDAHGGDDVWIWLRATIPGADGAGNCVYEVDTNGSDSETYQQSYTDDGSVVTLTGDPKPVDLMEVIGPDPDEDSDGNTAAATNAAPDAAAKAASGTAEEATAEFAEQLTTRVRALTLSASIYAD